MNREDLVKADKLLHKPWTKAVGTAGYDKEEWKELERLLWKGVATVSQEDITRLQEQSRAAANEYDETWAMRPLVLR